VTQTDMMLKCEVEAFPLQLGKIEGKDGRRGTQKDVFENVPNGAKENTMLSCESAPQEIG